MCSIVAVPLFFFLLGLKGLVERLSDDNIEETKKKTEIYFALLFFSFGRFSPLKFLFSFYFGKGAKRIEVFSPFYFLH